MDSAVQNSIQSDDIRLKELLQVLWRSKWSSLAIILALSLLAGGAAWISPKKYKAVIVVSPVTNTPGSGQMSGLSSLVSQIGGLASLTGLGGVGDSRKAESLAVLQSHAIAAQYIGANRLLPVLYAKRWDARTQRWKETDPEKIPTLWKASEYFNKHVRNVATDPKTGLVTVTVTWTDPHLAAEWANDLVKMTNDSLRNRAIEESDRNIAYLNEQASKTDVVGVKQAIYALLQNEINKEMVARGSDEYALKVLDPAVAPEAPSSPDPVLWVLLAMFAGVLLSVFVVFVRVAWSKG
jgi:uncharacterized protein involved in exopolysaccharide biosynthesis